jgi:GH35 family endo-1,4-beta-xylanase
MPKSIPKVVKTPQGGHHVLLDDKPFCILAGELQNSSFSSAEYMKPLWPKLIEDGVNTCFAGVYWASIEPEEGKFDFDELDEAIKDARENGMRLVLLWFASYKNGMSFVCLPHQITYAFEEDPRTVEELMVNTRYRDVNVYSIMGETG